MVWVESQSLEGNRGWREIDRRAMLCCEHTLMKLVDDEIQYEACWTEHILSPFV